MAVVNTDVTMLCHYTETVKLIVFLYMFKKEMWLNES
jgi:hypothetical protein